MKRLLSRGLKKLFILGLLFAVSIGGIASSAFAFDSTNCYTNWPESDDWVELTNHISWCYTSLVHRVEALKPDYDLGTNDIAPTYMYPYRDYTNFARKIDDITLYYVSQTNADADGTFKTYFTTEGTNGYPTSFPSWDITNLHLYAFGETNWSTNHIIHSWLGMTNHNIQTQVVAALTSLVWTVRCSTDYTDIVHKARGGIGSDVPEDDWPSGTTTQSFSHAVSYEMGNWDSASYSAGGLYGNPIYAVSDTYIPASVGGTVYGARVVAKPVLTNVYTNIESCCSVYLLFGLHPSYSSYTYYNNDTFPECPDIQDDHMVFVEELDPDSAATRTGNYPFEGHKNENPVAQNKRAGLSGWPGANIIHHVYCEDAYWLLKWDDSITPPDITYTNLLVNPDTGRDDLVDVGADLFSLGADSGNMIFRVDQDEPYVTIPLASSPAWYGGLHVNAYLSQGGHTNLPYYYLVPDNVDGDGHYQAYSLNTRVIQSGSITNQTQTNKLASILRPRGNLVVFEFPWEDGDFSEAGYPMGVNSNRTYVLHDVTPDNDSDFSYNLYFESGVVHEFGTNGYISSVTSVGGANETVSCTNIVGGSITFSNDVPISASNTMYNVSLQWSAEDVLEQVTYTTRDAAATNTTIVTSDSEDIITSLDKSGITGVSMSDVSVSDSTITYEWGTVTRSQTDVAGKDRTVTLATTVTDCGTVTEEFSLNSADRVTERTITANGDSATTTYEYYTTEGRYDNGMLKNAKLQKVTYPDDSYVEYSYDTDTGWISEESSPIGNGSDSGVEYYYTPDHSGDAANTTNLVERPRIVNSLYDSTIIGRTLYSYSGVSQMIIQQCTNASSAWGASGNLITTNTYITDGFTNGLILSAVYPTGDSAYEYQCSEADGMLSVTSTNSSGETIISTNNAFGYTEGSVIEESGQTAASAISTVDSLGRILRTDYLDGTYTENSSYGLFGPTSVTERDGSTTTYTYGNIGWVAGTTNSSLSLSTAYDYDALGNVTNETVTGGAQDVTRSYAYDAQGRILTSTDPVGTTTYSYQNQSFGVRTTTTRYSAGISVIEDRYYDGSIKQISGDVQAEMEYEYGVESDQYYTKEINSDNSSEWTKTYFTLLGGASAIKRAGTTNEAVIAYAPQGYRSGSEDEDGVAHEETRNSQGRIQTSGHDVDNDGTLDAGETDRYSFYVRQLSASGVRNESYVYPVDNDSSSNLMNYTETSFDGKQITSVYADRTNTVGRSSFTGAGAYTVTNNNSDGTYTVFTYDKFRLSKVEKYNKASTVWETEDYNYDGLGALTSVVNSRSGTATYQYDSARRLISIDSPGGRCPIQYAYYDGTSRIKSRRNADGSVTRYDYYDNGLLEREYDFGSYDISYEYDAQGRKTRMITIRDGVSVYTEWVYADDTGLLQEKKINGETVETYSYRDNGQLAAVTNANSVAMINHYSTAGDLESSTWSDATATICYTNIDRLARIRTKSLGDITNNYGYNLDSTVAVVTNQGVDIPTTITTYAYGSDHGRITQASRTISAETNDIDIAYDDWMRVSTITSGDFNVTYQYATNALWVTNLIISLDGTNVLEKASVWNPTNNHIETIEWTGSNFTNSYEYQYQSNEIETATGTVYYVSDRIGRITHQDNSYWEYDYDNRDHLISGCKYFSGGAECPGMQFGYGYDTIGNTTNSGFLAEDYRPAHEFVASNINVHATRIWSNKLEIVGTTINDTNVIVTVNNTRASMTNEWFYCLLPISNDVDSVETNITIYVVTNAVSVDIVASATGTIFAARSEEPVDYTAMAEMDEESRFDYTWDGFGRLTEAVASNANQRLVFTYYPDGQRATKKVYAGSPGDWTNTYTHSYVYDTWNLVYEEVTDEQDSSNSYTNSYLWGLDLAGQHSGRYGQSAGGIGGLLAITQVSGISPQPSTYFPVSDHNGNIHKLVDESGDVVANYVYSPFGVLIGEYGDKADVCNFRFSSKYYDSETELYYYGYRYYDPASTKWLTRDPLGERGGDNLTAFCQNDPVNRYDPTGLASKWNPLGWPGKLVQGVGWVLKKSRIPLVKNVGPTIESAGTLVESPATFIEGVIILEVPTLKESGEEFASGTLGIIGLKTLLELDRWEYPPTGSIKVPPHINLAIREAHNTFWQAPAWEQWWDYNITGRKYWHTLSYSYMASEAGITEIPWLWLGGVVHELWPPDFHAEMGDHPIPFTSPGQGALHGPYRWGAIYSAPMTVVDLSGDIIANTSGLAAGLLFPKSWLDPYARITGKIIIGPPDEWRFQLQQFQQQP